MESLERRISTIESYKETNVTINMWDSFRYVMRALINLGYSNPAFALIVDVESCIAFEWEDVFGELNEKLVWSISLENDMVELENKDDVIILLDRLLKK